MTTRLSGFLAAAAVIATALPAAAQMPLTPSRPLPPPSDAAAYVPPPPNPDLTLQAKTTRSAPTIRSAPSSTPRSVIDKAVAAENASREATGISGSNSDQSTVKTPEQTARVQRKRPVTPADDMAAELNRRELRMLQAGD